MHDPVPAPEETVETTEELLICCGHSSLVHQDYYCEQCFEETGDLDRAQHDRDYGEDEPPAPEPAGEAEERLEHDDNAEYCAACGEFPPAPSTGTPGLDADDAYLVEQYHGFCRVCRQYIAPSNGGTTSDREDALSHIRAHNASDWHRNSAAFAKRMRAEGRSGY